MTAPAKRHIRLSELRPDGMALYRETHDPHVIAHFTVPGEPESKLRARWDTRRANDVTTALRARRFARRGSRPVTPKQTKEAELTIGWLFRKAVGPFRPDRTSRFGVQALFVCHPSRPRDGDNLLKLILDALTGVCWVDDTQVDEQSTKTVYAYSGHKTVVVVYRLPDLAVAP